MTEAVEGGGGIAWRLLATLEGGSLLLATSALLAYTARTRVTRVKRQRNINSVLVTDIQTAIGKELKTQLEARGCVVSTVTNDATSGGASEAESGADVRQIDALVVIGSGPEGHSLNDVAQLISEDVYKNLRYMESLAARVRRGGCVAWACAGATSGAYCDAVAAFDTVLRATMQHVAKIAECEAVWIGRCESPQQAIERILAELLPSAGAQQSTSESSMRNAAHKVTEYLGRWLKIIT